MGIEPTRPAWKAGALPLSYTRYTLPKTNAQELWWRKKDSNLRTHTRADLQSAAIDHSATPPDKTHCKIDHLINNYKSYFTVNVFLSFFYPFGVICLNV